MPVFPGRPVGRVVRGEPRGGQVCHAQPRCPPLIEPVVIVGSHRPPHVIYPAKICSNDRSFDGRFVYDYELPRVVAFAATADTEFETIRKDLTMGLILLIVLIVLLLGGLPRWDYSRNWGYGPSGGLGLVLVIVLILLLLGRIPSGF
jgi:Protein of unknown function (DUF3309)